MNSNFIYNQLEKLRTFSSENYINNMYRTLIYYGGKMTAFKWCEMPYPGEKFGPIGEGDFAGSWPLRFFKRDSENRICDLKGNIIAFDIQTPDDKMDFRGKQINEVKKYLKNLTPSEKSLALYWNSENVLLLHIKNVLTLLNTYEASAMETARILSIMGDSLSDALTLAFHFKNKFQIPRPVQVDPTLKTYINTSYDPSYPVGHGVVGGTNEVVLSYFFPEEKEKLKNIAEKSSMSRVYGGIHYPADVKAGLSLGRHIGRLILEEIKNGANSTAASVNTIFTEYKNAPLEVHD